MTYLKLGQQLITIMYIKTENGTINHHLINQSHRLHITLEYMTWRSRSKAHNYYFKNTLTQETHSNCVTSLSNTLSPETAPTRFNTMNPTAEERMARFIAMPKDHALNSYRAHKGKKTEIISSHNA